MNDLRYYRSLGVSTAQTVGTLSMLVDCCVLRDAGSGLEFVNDLVRTRLYLRIPQSVRKQLHALVADDLLKVGAEGTKLNGLELAWHLMRCGRHEDAVSHLLRGARDAIDHGAAWEAERALGSGSALLVDESAAAGRLLLAEALFEQGRETESRSVALLPDSGVTDSAHDLGTAIAVAALARVPEQPVDDARRSFYALTSLMRGSEGGRARAIAARGAAMFALKLSDAEYARALLDATEEVGSVALDVIDRADIGYARATALYLLRHLSDCEREAASAIARLEQAHIANSTLLALYCGRGAVRCASGKYDDAVGILKAAHLIARRVGNPTIARACLSNLALCSFRLGDTRGQIHWGEMAQRRGAELQATFGDATYAYHLAMGYALSGEIQRAFDALAAGDSAASSLSPEWARQSWLLARADVLAVLGRHEEAKRVGRDAVGVEFPTLLSDSRAGPYARWKARTVNGSEEARAVRVELLELLQEADRFDAVDQAELLASIIMLGQLLGIDVSTDAEQLRITLSQLPSAVGTTLRLLGFLEHATPLDAARKSRRRRRSAVKQAADPEELHALRRNPAG
jgi:tetratricopeptide (TPR) repeat protein